MSAADFLLPAPILLAKGGVWRFLRLPQADPEEIFIVLGLALLGLVAILAAVLVPLLRSRWLRRRQSAAALASRLNDLALDEVSRQALIQVAELAEDTPESCLASVEVFDRGVERLIARAATRAAGDRLDLLRTLRTLRRRLNFDQANPQEPLKSTRCLAVDQEMILALEGAAKAAPDVEGDEDHFVATVFHNEETAMLLRLLPAVEQPLKRSPAIKAGQAVKVHFFRPNEGAYSFDAVVLEFRDRGPGFVRLRHARSLRRRQRRNYLRVELREPVFLRWFPRRGLPRGPGSGPYEGFDAVFKEHEGVAADLSGGGLKLEVAGLDLQCDDWLEVRLPFLSDGLGELSCFARVAQIYQPAPAGVFGLELESPPARLEIGIIKEVDRRHRRAATAPERNAAASSARASPSHP